jgi:hypothetical protein
MIGSLTIGSFAVMALSMTAEAAAKGILGKASRNTYASLKEKISQWADCDFTILEKMYTSWTRKAHIAKVIEQRPPVDQAHIRDLTAALIEALKRDVRRGSVGISLRRLEAMQEQLMAVSVT